MWCQDYIIHLRHYWTLCSTKSPLFFLSWEIICMNEISMKICSKSYKYHVIICCVIYGCLCLCKHVDVCVAASHLLLGIDSTSLVSTEKIYTSSLDPKASFMFQMLTVKGAVLPQRKGLLLLTRRNFLCIPFPTVTIASGYPSTLLTILPMQLPILLFFVHLLLKLDLSFDPFSLGMGLSSSEKLF